MALWASFLVAFCGFLRKSNTVPPSFNHPSLKYPRRDDIVFTSFGMVLILRWTKSIQFNQRSLSIPIVNIPGSPLCPVQAYQQLCNACPVSGTAPAFAYTKDSVLQAITYSKFTSRLKVLLDQIGLNSSLWGGHSFCRGGCSLGFRAKVPAELLKCHGDWASSCYMRYIEFSDTQRLSVTHAMAEVIKSQT